MAIGRYLYKQSPHPVQNEIHKTPVQNQTKTDGSKTKEKKKKKNAEWQPKEQKKNATEYSSLDRNGGLPEQSGL